MRPLTLYKKISACRACGSDQIHEVLNLGDFSLSDFTARPEAPEKAPLTLVRCKACSLVQLRHSVDRERLYRNYFYKSGIQPVMVEALQGIVDEARALVKLAAGDAVLDIGANDGTLLRMWDGDLIRMGFEPAQNLFQEASGHPSLKSNFIFPAFWPPNYDVKPESKPKVITSIACFYDTDDPNGFVKAIKRWLHPEGVWINQLAYLPDTIQTNNLGDICHEHLTYWTLQAFASVLEKHSLKIDLVSHNDVNGGSVRFIVRHGENFAFTGGLPVPSDADLTVFKWRIESNRHRLKDLLKDAKRFGKKVIGYAAATKFNTALQYWDIGPDLMPMIADRNPDKHGKYTPTGQQVISEEEMRELKPDYLLCGAFHFLDAFIERERGLLDAGTQFIVPFPQVRLVGGTDARSEPRPTQAESRAVQAA